ncbi:MAG TPA: hypothetical protein VD931_02365 [Baekduia sp.]|nr:hypothetical protein [Baekduia sp.]
MTPRLLPALCAAVLLCVPAAAGAKGPVTVPDEGPDPRGVTVSGTGFAFVVAPAQRTDAAIGRAVDAARVHAHRRAIAAARTRAAALAEAAGLALGDPQAVMGRDPEAEMGFVSQPPCRGIARCRVPLLSASTVTVTFATRETSAAQTTGRAVVASRAGSSPVLPENRHSSASIRATLVAARLPADAAALAGARAEVARLAAAAGAPVGALLAIAERLRPFDDPALGSFGPGRYCGPYRRAVVRRDPRTGRRRVVRRILQRRCFFPPTATTTLRVTYAA